MTVRATLLAVLLLVSPAAAFAQPLREQITVNVVEVPVHVERFGVAVEGLTCDDFELFVNGSRQRIEYFDVLDHRVENVPDAHAARDLRRRSLSVLLFDTGASDYVNLREARKAAARYIESAPADETFAIATIGRGAVKFVVPFIRDRASLLRAITTLAPSRDLLNVAAGVGDTKSALERWEETERATEGRSFIENLAAFADRLAALQGMKRVVLLSDRRGAGDSLNDALFEATRLHARYRRARVILDAVDIGANAAPWPGAETFDALPSPLLYALSLDTGGVVAASLASLNERNGITYILGFQHRGGDRGSVKVRLKNAAVLTSVRYSQSFDLSARGELSDGVVLADAIVNDVPLDGVTVAVDTSVEDGGVAIQVSTPGREILAAATGEELAVEIYVYVFDDRNLVADWAHAKVSIDVDKGRQSLLDNGYVIRKRFSLPPGHYAAKTLVRIGSGERVGFRRTDFEVTHLQ